MKRELSLATLDTLPAVAAKGESEDALMGRQLSEQWDKVVGGQREQLIFGAMMLKLRERLAVSARGHGGKFGNKGDGIKAWLEVNAPRVGRSTAYRLLEIAEGLQEEFKLGKKIDLELLLAASVENLPENLAKKRAEIEKCIEGQSQRQLLLTFGKEKTRKGGKTYERENGKGERKPMTEEEARQEAIDIWTPLLKSLAIEGLKECSWAALPDRGEISRETLKGLLIDLNRKVPAVKEL